MAVVSLRSTKKSNAPIHFLGFISRLMPDGRYAVANEEGVLWECRRAASCLLRPAIGDTVLVSGPDSVRVYLIAVIEQADASSSRIEAPGDVTVGASGDGRVRITSSSNLSFCSDKKILLKAKSGECNVGELRLTTRSMQAAVGCIRLVSKMFESVTDRAVQMARQSLRLIDEFDQVRAGHLDYKASETVHIHGHHTIVTGKELVKMDAAQIHMG